MEVADLTAEIHRLLKQNSIVRRQGLPMKRRGTNQRLVKSPVKVGKNERLVPLATPLLHGVSQNAPILMINGRMKTPLKTRR